MTQPPHPPLFTPPQATALLDQIIYEQVLECIDLDAIYHLERSLTMMIAELHAMPHDRATQTTQALLDRCLLRLPDDIRRYLRAGPFFSIDGADRCEDRPNAPPPRRPPPSRFSS